MKNSALILLGAVTVLISFSCTEESAPVPFTYSKVFTGETSKTWALDGLYLREAGKTDERLSLAACERDDRYIFYNNAERLLEVTNGAQSCDASEEDLLLSYEWSFANPTATLTMVTPHIFGYVVVPFIVKKATSTTMELEIFLNEGGTISYVLQFEALDEN